MDELQIERILRQQKWTKKTFNGVYSSNTLPKTRITERPCGMVVNTDQDDEPGSHWIAIYLDENGHGEYFDSYGLFPMSKHILDFLNKQTKNNWTFNKRQLQHVLTTMCGAYCIFFLVYRGQYKRPMYEIIDMMFPVNESVPLANDFKVQKSLYQRFGLNIPIIESDFVAQKINEMYKH